ncbi:MAG: ABC transporter permease [Candidatus Aminicenantia bacterium]
MAKINIREILSISLKGLWAHKLRTTLTLVGVIIGVFTLIAVVSIIQGLNRYVRTKLFNYGTNDFYISKYPPFISDFEKYLEYMKRKNLTLKDAYTIQELCKNCNLVGAHQSSVCRVKYGSKYMNDVRLSGMTHNSHLIGWVFELEAGRHILEEDMKHSRYICIIGADIREKLFPFQDPIGKVIKIDDKYFQIVGIGKKSGKVFGVSQDNYVRVPLTTFYKIRSRRENVNIEVHTLSQAQMKEAIDEVRIILRAKRKLSPKQEDDFAIVTQETFIEFYKNTTTSLFIAMIIVSSIALIVGGIGIMNIMLVSVTERTKEIGIRMSVGARRVDILKQFLIESSFLSGTGGVIGIVLGFLIAKIVSAFSSLPSTVELWSVFAGLALSLSVGIFFGIYPAHKASKLDPAEALRRE